MYNNDIINFAILESKYDYYVSHVYGLPKAVFPNVYVAETQDLKSP